MTNGRRRPKLQRVRQAIADRKWRRGLLRQDLLAVQQAGEALIPRSLIEVRITADAPEGTLDQENWRRADIIVGGEVEATGFARRQSKKDPWKLAEAEASALAWHYFKPKVRIARPEDE